MKVKRRKYSSKEKAAHLAQIEASIKEGMSVGSAMKAAGVPRTIYYAWLKDGVKPEASPGPSLEPVIQKVADAAHAYRPGFAKFILYSTELDDSKKISMLKLLLGGV